MNLIFYRQLSNGYTSIMVKDGDFIFTFDLFVYDEVHYRFIPKMITHPGLYSPTKNTIGKSLNLPCFLNKMVMFYFKGYISCMVFMLSNLSDINGCIPIT